MIKKCFYDMADASGTAKKMVRLMDDLAID